MERNRQTFFWHRIPIVLACLLMGFGQSANADEPKYGTNSGMSIFHPVNSPRYRFSLYMFEDDGSWSYWYNTAQLTIGGHPAPLTGYWPSDMQSFYRNQRCYGWEMPDTEWGWMQHYYTKYNGDKEGWSYFVYVPRYAFCGYNLNVNMSGYWKNNNYTYLTRSLSFSMENQSAGPTDATVTREPGKLVVSANFNTCNTGDLYTWRATLFTTQPGATEWLEPTADNSVGGTTRDFNRSTSKAEIPASNWMAYTVYPRFSAPRNSSFVVSLNDASGTIHSLATSGTTIVKDHASAITLPGYPRAAGVSVEGKKWAKTVNLSWNSEVYDPDNCITDGSWYVFRKNLADETVEIVGSDISYNVHTFTDDSETLGYNIPYKYYVCFVPNGWTVNSWTDAADLWASKDFKLLQEYQFKAFTADGNESNIDLAWKLESFGNANNSNTYDVVLQRSVNNNTNWTDIFTQTINSSTIISGSYTDEDVSNPCTNYYYRLMVQAQDTTFYSVEKVSSITGVSKVTSIAASRGTYSGRVRIQWEAEQYGTADTYYTLKRRLIGSGDDKWVTLHTTNGTAVTYNYQDDTAQPGDYYEYQVTSETKCQEANSNVKNSVTTDGFCQARGVVSGRISYGTGTAVEGAQVLLTRSSNSDSGVQSFYSLRLQGIGEGVLWPIPTMLTSAYTVQFFLRPELDKSRTANTVLLEESGAAETPLLQLSAYNSTKESYQLILKGSNTGVNVKYNEFTLITLRYDGTNYTLSTFDKNRKVATYTKTGQAIAAGNLLIGYSSNVNKPQFQGYLDEIRIYSRAITDKEITSYADRTLSGSEDDLVAYIPLDEGVQALTKAYDYSKTAGAANENHGDLAGGTFDTTIPDSTQLGLLSYTDSQGNYVVRGVPFNGDGTNYSITPLMNSHEFSPEKQSRFVSVSSLVHSGVDFTDVSSFEVRGIVRYSGTNIPVDSVQILVDGKAAARNNEIVATNEKGEFVVDVPIGRHYISVSKDGHTFEAGGRIPKDPTGLDQATYEFKKPESGWEFWDNTLVTVAGRVVGGAVEGNKPLGFADNNDYKSKSTIGQARITLEIPDKRYMLNAYEKMDGLVSLGFKPVSDDKPLTYPAGVTATGVGYRTGGDQTGQAQQVVITTDAATGDFAVLLPPLDYKVVSVQMVNDAANEAYKFDPEKLPSIDASKPATVLKDSIPTDDGGFRYFEYVASMKLTKLTDPVLEVRQYKFNSKQLLPEGVYGNPTAPFTFYNNDSLRYETVNVDLYTAEDNGDVTYNFGYPIFGELGQYTFQLKGYELYQNYDDGLDEEERVTEVPLKDMVVTISNEMSASQKVRTADAENGEDAGKAVNLKEDQLQLDENGEADYTWIAGTPFTLGNFTKRMNMTYDNGEGPRLWKGLDGIIFGDLPYGSNFATMGPARVDMVLHDPYGDSSFATWEKGKVHSRTHETVLTGTDETTVSNNIHIGPKLEFEQGLIFSLQTEIQVIAEVETGYTRTEQHDTIDAWSSTVENLTVVSTSADPDMVGANADIYIGKSTNKLFGAAQSVGLKADKNGLPKVKVEEVITVGEEFSTNFFYTQYEIENAVIPNLKKMRNQLIETVPDVEAAKNNGDNPRYVTELAEEDPNYGNPDTYKYLPGNNSSIDEVLYYNEAIQAWIDRIADNEKYKVDTFKSKKIKKANVSFGGGTEITESVTNSSYTDKNYVDTYSYRVNFGRDFGATYNGVGFDVDFQSQKTADDPKKNRINGSHTNETENTTTTTFSYTLADDDIDDHFTVDICDATSYHSPVFRTKGGQSSCPYEDKEVTKYYEPGTELTTATVQIEQPIIRCLDNTLTGVPTGGQAQFELELYNNSAINADTYFELVPVDGANPKGARLSLPTGPIEDGRTVFIPAGNKPVKIILTLEQVNLSVTDYEDIKIALKSTCQNDEASIHGVIKSEVSLSAHFVPASTPVILAIDKTVVNKNNVDDDLRMTVTGFDKNFTGLRRVDIQYKRPGEQSWTLLKSYIPSYDVQEDAKQELLPEKGVIELTQSMKSWTDGTYQFRAQSSANYSGNTVTSESDILTVIKDVQLPQLFGLANPADGVLNAGDEISLTFNEDIQKEMLTDNNIVVSGILNGDEVAHDVALSAQNTERAAYTDADINLAKKDFSADMWVNVTEAGDIFAHGNGDEKFKLSIDGNNKLVVTIGTESYTSTKSIDKNTWTFLAFNYDYEIGHSVLNVRAVTDNATEDLFYNAEVADYAGTGSISLGQNFTGAIQELTLWDNARSVVDAQTEMHYTKKPSTPHLIGYWKMDEGSGTQIRDYARNRHMTLPNSTSWYLNNDNKAVTLDGTNALKLNITNCESTDFEDYAVEMWFKGAKADNTAASSLLYAGEESVGMGFNDSGDLTMYAKGSEISILNSQTTNLLDNAWHHLALNVLRNGNATVYVDGTPVKSLSAKNIPSLVGTYLYIGTREGSYPFTGLVDEIRLWKASLTGDLLTGQRTQRLTGTESGLVAYYPFETLTKTNGLITSESTAQDFSAGAMTAETYSGAAIAYSDEAPALKVKPAATNVNYNFVANERSIIITLDENADRLEGTTLTFNVNGVKDMNGNESMPVEWTAYIRQNSLLWKGETEVSVEKMVGENATFEATIVNESGNSENWSLSGLPSWLTASATSGTLKATMQKTITFTVAENTAPGKYEQTIYLTGNKNIAEPFTLYLKVKSEEPDWAVNKGLYQETMNVIGSLQVLGVTSQDEDDMVGAFIDDECRGVSHLEYNQRYDGYFVTMDIYGNSGDKKKPLTFKVFDASAGIIYPVVNTSLDNDGVTIMYKANDFQGKYSNPVVFNATDEIEQNIEMAEGWNWISFSVKPDEMTTSTVFANAGNRASAVVKSSGNDQYDDENGVWAWNIELNNKEMYVVDAIEDFTLNVTGHRVNPANEPITLKKNWNWIAYNGQQVVSLADALGGIQPAPNDGDIIKGQQGVAYYDVYEWIGSLRTLTPGKGYKYKNSTSTSTSLTLRYPASTAGVAAARMAGTESASPKVFAPVDYRNYAENMVLIAQVVRNGLPVADAELGVFAGEECREAYVTNGKGMVIITVPGDAATKLSFRVADGGEVYYAAETVSYKTDAVIGTPRAPFVIELGNATGIESVTMASQHNGQMYDLQGRRIQRSTFNGQRSTSNGQRSTLKKGVYIINGQKQVK